MHARRRARVRMHILTLCALSRSFRTAISQGIGCGDDAYSYAYDGERQRKWHGGVRVRACSCRCCCCVVCVWHAQQHVVFVCVVQSWQNYGSKWKSGDVITCTLDLDAGCVMRAIARVLALTIAHVATWRTTSTAPRWASRSPTSSRCRARDGTRRRRSMRLCVIVCACARMCMLTFVRASQIVVNLGMSPFKHAVPAFIGVNDIVRTSVVAVRVCIRCRHVRVAQSVQFKSEAAAFRRQTLLTDAFVTIRRVGEASATTSTLAARFQRAKVLVCTCARVS
jgi:hypothetical protein